MTAETSTPSAPHARSEPKVSIFADCTDESMPVLDLAIALEERGFDGLYLNEHTHMPVENPNGQWPGEGDTPPRYGRFWCPYTALAFVAARTNIELGTAISLVGEHDAIALAKTIATLDVLSEGRLVLGVGFGWNRDEFADHGHSFKVRAKVVEETVRAMRNLWTDEVASFSGDYVSYAPSYAWPKPSQKPHPPVILGVRASERNFKRMAEWCDGWIPQGLPDFWDGGFRRELEEFRAAWELAGRDPATIQLVTFLNLPAERLPDAMERARDHGVQRILLRIRDEQADEAKRRLDDFVEIRAKAFG